MPNPHRKSHRAPPLPTEQQPAPFSRKPKPPAPAPKQHQASIVLKDKPEATSEDLDRATCIAVPFANSKNKLGATSDETYAVIGGVAVAVALGHYEFRKFRTFISQARTGAEDMHELLWTRYTKMSFCRAPTPNLPADLLSHDVDINLGLKEGQTIYQAISDLESRGEKGATAHLS
jgi:hypothetical protein